MMEAHFFVIIDSWGKCRLSTVPLKTGNDGMTAGLPQALGWGTIGHLTVQISILLTPLSGDLLRTMIDAFNRNRYQNYSRPWRTLQQPFQWRCCATQLKMCANAPRPVLRLLVAISSIPFSRCKNADS